MYRSFFLIFLFIFTCLSARTQSLHEFMNTALENNYNIHIARIQEDISKNNNTAGNAGFLPTIELSGQYTNSFNTTQQKFFDGDVREGDNAKNTNLSGEALLNWTIFDGFRMFANKDQLGILQDQGAVNVRFYVDQTLADIATVYYQLIKEHEILKNYKRALKVSDYRVRLEEKRREVGTGIGLDYYQAIVSLQNDSSQILSQKSVIRSLEIELNRITNRPLETSVEPSDSLHTRALLEWDLEELVQMAGQRNQELQQAQLDELIAETNIRYEKADRFPVVGLFGGYTYTRSSSEIGFTESNRSYGPNIGVNIRFNLFNGGNESRQIRNAVMQRNISKNYRQQVENNVDAELTDTITSYTLLQEQVALASKSVEAAQKALDIANAQLREGVITGIDFRAIQVSLINAQNALQQLEYMLTTLEINMYRLTSQVTERYL